MVSGNWSSAMDPFWGAIGSAGVSSAAQIAGGFLSGPDQSQRDLMWEGQRIWEHQMRNRYDLQSKSLKSAGLNPILAVAQPPPSGGGPTAPQPYTNPLGAAVGEAGKSASSGFMVHQQLRQVAADTKLKEAQATSAEAAAKLADAQTKTEEVRPGSVLAQQARDYAAAQHSSAMTAHEQQKMGRTMIETAIAREELTIAEKDAVIAAIDLDLYRSHIGEVARVLQQLGFSAGAARAAGAALLKLFGVGARKGGVMPLGRSRVGH